MENEKTECVSFTENAFAASLLSCVSGEEDTKKLQRKYRIYKVLTSPPDE